MTGSAWDALRWTARTLLPRRAHGALRRRLLGTAIKQLGPGFWTPSEYAAFLRPDLDVAPYDALVSLLDRELPTITPLLDRLRAHFPALASVPDDPADELTPFWRNTYFTGDDARIAYAVVRERRPPLVVEVGSGNSTKFIRRAISDGATSTRLISLDPSPRAEIDRLCDEVIRKPLLEVPLELFDRLERGSVLFLDGSHLAVQGSDAPHFFLRVLPRIRPGVLVHVHDIFLPYQYGPEFRPRFYGEQYVLAAALLYGDALAPRIPVAYLKQRGLLAEGGVSFWFEVMHQRTAAPRS